MKLIAKTMLVAFTRIESVANQIKGTVDKKVESSASNIFGVLELAEKIINLIEIKESMLLLKRLIRKMLRKLNSDDLALLIVKYFKRMQFDEVKDKLNYNERMYFRKQNLALERFSKVLIENGYDEKWWKKNYDDILWLREIRCRLTNEDEKIKTRTSEKRKKVIAESSIQVVA